MPFAVKLLQAMDSTTFWVLRFLAVISATATSSASLCILLKSRYGLYESLPMKYVLAVAACELAMNILSVLMAILGVAGALPFNPDCSAVPLSIGSFFLAAEGAIYNSLLMVSFFLVFMLTFVIERVLELKGALKSQKLWIAGGTSTLTLTMVIMGSLTGFAVCSEPTSDTTYISYDAACLCFKTGRFWPVVIWCLLMVGIGIPTLVLILKIAWGKMKGHYDNHRQEFKLAFVAYYIPPVILLLYILQIVMQLLIDFCGAQQLCGDGLSLKGWLGLSVASINLMVLPSLVILLTVIKYRWEYRKYHPLYRMSSKQELVEQPGRTYTEMTKPLSSQ